MERVVNNKIYPSLFKWVVALLVLMPAAVLGQKKDGQPILEKTITLRFTNERTDAVLNTISREGGFNFSYNPSILDPGRLVSGEFNNKPVREILNTIFSGKIEFRERKGYVILQKPSQVTKPSEKNESFVYSGYVRDEAGVALPWVSIYDKTSLESTISNDYGFYKIRFSAKHLPLTLYFSKQGYADTIVRLNIETPSYNNITLGRPALPVAPVIDYDSLSVNAENTVQSFFNTLEGEPNALNIKDTLYRKYQVSLLPYVGTNLQLSGNVINDYSFNVFGGISLGTVKAELGGFFNLNKSDVKYLQLAGFANLNGGNVSGVQLAGFTNLVKNNVEGVQLSGFVNADLGSARGVIMSGFANSVKGNMKGVQMAGFANIAMDTVTGFQGAGFANVVFKSMNGVQLAGFINIVPDTLKGTQLGIINYAGHVSGSQLGFLNVSKSTTGIPVGFLSYVHKGYHKIEISADELFPVNVAFRSGVNSFHNILTAGLDPFSGDSLLWNFGYGFGSSVVLSPKTFLDFDLTGSQVVKANSIEKINIINKFYLGIDTRLAKNVSIAFGVTLNGQVTNTGYSRYPDVVSYYEPQIFYDESWESDNTRLQMWLGAKAGLRFF